MSEEKLSNHEKLFAQYMQIVDKQYPDLPHDVKEDAAIGSVIKITGGSNPSSVLLAAAHDLNVHASAQGIIDYVFAEQKKKVKK